MFSCDSGRLEHVRPRALLVLRGDVTSDAGPALPPPHGADGDDSVALLVGANSVHVGFASVHAPSHRDGGCGCVVCALLCVCVSRVGCVHVCRVRVY